jgi:phage tail sheath gpL-like
MAGFDITGYPSSYRAPFSAVEVLLGQGQSSAAAAFREAVVVGPFTAAAASAGTVANTEYRIRTESDADTYAGVRGPAYQALRMALKAGCRNLWYLAHAPSSGGGATSATGEFVVTGPATGSGQIVFQFHDTVTSVNFVSGDSATAIGDLVEAKLNGIAHAPATWSNAAGTVTGTAPVAGASQNGIYRMRVISVTPGQGVGCTASAATIGTAGGGNVVAADGATTENSLLVAALATYTATRRYYMCFTSPVQADLVSALAHIATKSDPNPGLRSRGFGGAVGTLAATATIAVALNSERFHLAWQKNSDHDPASLAGNLMAITQKREAVESHYNFDGYSGADWFIRPAYANADWPDADDKNDAVTDGICCIESNQARSALTMHVTTRSKNAAGTIDDFRATESHRVSVLDEMADQWIIRDQLTYANFHLRDDEYLADGVTINTNQKLPTRTVTPSRYKSWLVANVLTPAYNAGKIQRINEWTEATDVIIDEDNASRLQASSSGRTCDQRHQVSWLLAETTPS